MNDLRENVLLFIADSKGSDSLTDLLRLFGDYAATASWNTWYGMIGGLAACLVGIAAITFLLSSFLERWAKIKEAGEKIGWIRDSNEFAEFLLRRKQFCTTLQSDIAAINKAESWNDQYFADLEAEVEADGGYFANRLDRLTGRRSFGLRRVRSLIDAISTSSERCLLLVGEPGSGKSIALRHLASQLASRTERSRRAGAKIPLYINLREIPPSPEGGPTVDFIRQFVLDNVRRADIDTANYVKEHWQRYTLDGVWFFLFDSFDEIPEIMHADSQSSVIEKYASAIEKFLGGMGSCRGVLASREYKGPRQLLWPKFRVLALSAERQDELVDRSFLDRKNKARIKTYLAQAESEVFRNPMFVSLLCRHMKEVGTPPESDYDLLNRHIKRLAERDTEHVQSKYQLSPIELISAAGKLAVLFAQNKRLSLAPTFDELVEASEEDIGSRLHLNSALSALVYVKVLRSDVQEAKPGDRRFAFAHRRYQETLFVEKIASGEINVPPRALLMDARWREYMVTLLQSQPKEVIGRYIFEARTLLTELAGYIEKRGIAADGERNCQYFHLENSPLVELLTLLQDGLARRQRDCPSELAEAIERLLVPLWNDGDLCNKTTVLMTSGLVRDANLECLIAESVTQPSATMQRIAFGKLPFLHEISPTLAEWLRATLAADVLIARSKSDLRRIEALCANLPSGTGATVVLRRCIRLRIALKWLQVMTWPLIAPLDAFRKIVRSGRPIETRPNPSGSNDRSLTLLVMLLLLMGIYGIAAAFFVTRTYDVDLKYALVVLLAIVAPVTWIVTTWWYRDSAFRIGSMPFLSERFRKLGKFDAKAAKAALPTAVAIASVFGGMYLLSWLFPKWYVEVLTFLYFVGFVGLLGVAVRKGTLQKRAALRRLDELLTFGRAQGHNDLQVLFLAHQIDEAMIWVTARRSELLSTDHHVRSYVKGLLFGLERDLLHDAISPLPASVSPEVVFAWVLSEPIVRRHHNVLQERSALADELK